MKTKSQESERDEKLKQIIETINSLQEDTTIPRNIKEKMRLLLTILQENEDVSIRVDKALQELDEISDDANIQAFTRTQIWNIVSMLEKI